MSSFDPQGLSSEEAARRLRESGPNEIPSAESRGAWRILAAVLREPMILLLVGCASIYFALGESKDGAILLFSVLIVLAITLYQEWKSERAIEALRDLSSPRALVIRDGAHVRIAGKDVVPGDLLVVSEGDRIAADATLASSRHLRVDESLLTGESLSVTKTALDGGDPAPMRPAPAESRLFAGTLAVAGHGIGRVVATGAKTQMGRIGQSLQAAGADDQTRLQKELARLIRVFGIVGVAFSLLIVVTYGLTRGDWPQGLLVGLATAMSLLPEEFPVVLAVFLAMGAWRISKARVLTRRISATESLGSITVLCVDKTGTLTRNQMQVRVLEADDGQALTLEPGLRLGAPYSALIEHGALACPVDPFDPMEKAIRAAAPASSAALELIREYPLSSQLLAMTLVWKPEGSGPLRVAAKGAPEAILELCRIAEAERRAILDRVQALASQGLRVLGVARAEHERPAALPENAKAYSFRFLGLIGLEDPVRPEVPAALRECYSAGIRVIMMTGDFSGTARSIARQIGFENADQVVSGAELQGLSEGELSQRIQAANVFSRMLPEQKLRVIRALKASSQIVAMTGDGVNDAPSLKWADVGIAMGGRGTDVAREAASIVLLDDNFASIVAAIRLGRRIFDNISKALAYILAVHVPIAGMAMLPVLLGTPLVLLPAHIVFLELVIDPASALLFEGEAAEPNVMRRPPRSLAKPLFGAREILRNMALGGIALVFVFLSYWIALAWEQDGALARTVAFMSLVLSNLGLILANRSRSSGLIETLRTKNRTFAWLVAATLSLLALALALPAARAVFRFAPLHLHAALLAIASGALTLLCVQAARRIWKEEPA
jgi:Ca2+-transporting ATPase